MALKQLSHSPSLPRDTDEEQARPKRKKSPSHGHLDEFFSEETLATVKTLFKPFFSSSDIADIFFLLCEKWSRYALIQEPRE